MLTCRKDSGHTIIMKDKLGIILLIAVMLAAVLVDFAIRKTNPPARDSGDPTYKLP